jgi:hypothetical protein
VASNEPGVLPKYLDPVDFSPLHPEPESLRNRIKNKFNPAIFDSDAPVFITWTKSNFVSGGIIFFGSSNFRDVSAGLAYAAPSTILQKPSGSTQDIVDYQVRTVSVCVFDLIIGKASPELCPFQSGQDSCPRQGPKAPGNTSFYPVRQPASMCSRDNVLVDDCFTDAHISVITFLRFLRYYVVHRASRLSHQAMCG